MHSGTIYSFGSEKKERQRQKEIARQIIAENTREGLHQTFHPNGQLFHEWTVVNGKKDGVLREWNENGVLIKETPMKRGTVHGTVKQWNSKGTFLGEYKMKMGKGIVRKWNEDGVLSTEAEHFGNNTLHVKVYGDPKKKFHKAFLWKDKPVSKKKFYELLSGNA